MRKPLQNTFMLFLVGGAAYAQTLVPTTPQNRNIILEEFTGIHCPNCPAGHTTASGILNANPGRAYLVAFHPTGSNYTTPAAGEPDFRRTYPAAFYSMPFCGSSRFMPSAFINREKNSINELITGRTEWTGMANAVLPISSPMNVGVSSSYNTTTKMLTVNVEVYYTSAVTSPNFLYVTLSENNIVGYQSGSGGGSNYNHMHVFREAFVAQWGDPITGTTAGSLKQYTFTFDNSVKQYNMTNCEILAYVRDGSNEEIYSGKGAPVGTSSANSVEENTSNISYQVFPNPSSEMINVNYLLEEKMPVQIQVMDVFGKIVYSEKAEELPGFHEHAINVNQQNLASGIYLLKLMYGENSIQEKLIIE